MTADDRDIRTQRLIASRRRDSADKQRRTLTVIATSHPLANASTSAK